MKIDKYISKIDVSLQMIYSQGNLKEEFQIWGTYQINVVIRIKIKKIAK